MGRSFGIIDLFAGPGGLAEGFSAAGRETDTRMRIRLSIEKEATEVRTLRLRAFLRGFDDGFPTEYYAALNASEPLPDWSVLYPARWADACKEACQLELGRPGVFEKIAELLDMTREEHDGNTILIGGPPCQAYSLAGRSRNKGVADYVPEKDPRHFLYREYVEILKRLRPAAFVMENVKGMLSSQVDGGEIFERVLDDLRNAGDGYTLVPLSAPRNHEHFAARDFIVRAEEHGVPQARHRVFVVGIRNDLPTPEGDMPLMPAVDQNCRADVRSVLSSLPALRSGLSRQRDNPAAWRKVVLEHAKRLIASKEVDPELRQYLAELKKSSLARASERCQSTRSCDESGMPPQLAEWLIDPALQRISGHETRAHIAADLGRYLFVSAFGREYGRSPKLSDFPDYLLRLVIAPRKRTWLAKILHDRPVQAGALQPRSCKLIASFWVQFRVQGR